MLWSLSQRECKYTQIFIYAKKVSLTLSSKLEKSVKSVNLSIKNSGTNCVGENTLTLFKLCQDFY